MSLLWQRLQRWINNIGMPNLSEKQVDLFLKISSLRKVRGIGDVDKYTDVRRSRYEFHRHFQLLASKAGRRRRALMQAVDGELIGFRSALQVLANSPYLASGDIAKFYEQALEALRSMAGNNIVLLAAAGNQVLNTLRPLGEPLPVRGGPDQVFRPFETGRPFISDLFLGPVAGQPLVSIVVPVFSEGKVAYAVAVGIFPERLGEILRRQDIPPHWVAAIFDRTGTIVARTHLADKFVGKKGSTTLVRRMAEVPEGVIESETLEGIPVFSSFSRSAVSGWGVAIGIPTADALGTCGGHCGWASEEPVRCYCSACGSPKWSAAA